MMYILAELQTVQLDVEIAYHKNGIFWKGEFIIPLFCRRLSY